MAATKRTGTPHHIAADAAAAGILALLVDAREGRVKDDKAAARTEFLLSNAGLSVEDIQALTNKKPDTIRKAIQRSRGR